MPFPLRFPFSLGGPLVLSGTTLDALQSGSLRHAWVVAIEGYSHLLSDATEAAVQAAYADTDWASNTILGGIFVEIQNEQSIDPWNPFTRGGTAKVSVMPDAADTFGIDTHRRGHGAETQLGTTIGRTDTSVTLAFGSNFTADGEAHIGTECVSYSGSPTTTMAVTQRGKYSPFKTGTGAAHFANHHRVTNDTTGVALVPLVTQEPRSWIGKRVAIRMHKWDGSMLNSRDDAQLVFAGTIASITDDPDTMCTIVEIGHILDTLADAVVLRDQFGADCPDGVVTAGGTCSLQEFNGNTPTKVTNPLTIAAGRYAIDDLCGMLSNWLGGELSAARITGTYNWKIDSGSEGPRVKCHFSMANSAGLVRGWWLTLPREIAALMGFIDEAPVDTGTSFTVVAYVPGTDSAVGTYQGQYEPYRMLAFHWGGVEGLSYQIELVNQRGAWVDQSSYLPTAIKAITDGIDAAYGVQSWGIFLIDEKALAFGAFDDVNFALKYVYMAPWTLSTDDVRLLSRFGRKYSETNGPVTVRQVVMIEKSFKQLLAMLFYSTGTSGYNHASFDTLAYGLGIGVPGELLGPAFETSLANLPQADMPLMCIIDKPIRLADLIEDDLKIRRAFPVWKNGSIIFRRWQTPVVAHAVALLDESNKCAPSDNTENHRSSSVESDQFQYPIVVIKYNRDFGFGSGDQYGARLQLEDQVAVDDAGGTEAKSATISLRNVYAQFTQSGTPLVNLFSDYLAGMPMFSQPARKVTRSVDPRFWEGYAPGDIIEYQDNFSRDPLTGMRDGPTRAAVITRHFYDPGGPSPGINGQAASVRPMTGEVDLFFLDTHRGGVYGPAVDVDSTATLVGYDHGYNSSGASGKPSLWTAEHSYSESGENVDASHFQPGDKILITEIDPADPAAPIQWARTIDSLLTADIICLTSALSSPAWDNTKKYRISYDHYSAVQVTQQDFVFQADSTDQMIEDVEVADHYAIINDPADSWTLNTATALAEFLPDSAIGDGRTLDAGTDTALANLANQAIDRKTTKNSPMLWTQWFQTTGNTGDRTVNPIYSLIFCAPLYFGAELLNNTVTRDITIAPLLRLDNWAGATAGSLRITISRECPIAQPGQGPDWNTYDAPTWKQPYQQHIWTTSSTSWATGSDWTISAGYKDNLGVLWLTIEGDSVACLGLAKVVEGIRQVVS